MSWVPPMEKSNNCIVCGNLKAKVLRRYSAPDAWGERTVMCYEVADQDEAVMRVYCSHCGIVYHEGSVYA